MGADADIEEIKNALLELNRKFDELLEERDTMALMKLSEKGLEGFIAEEPDIYTVKDLKVRYK
jgi:hypothetical protein